MAPAVSEEYMTMDEIQSKARDYIRFEENEGFRKEMEDLLSSGNEQELSDRFYTDLSFGTGGLRGVIGAGYNRMNTYVVRRATKGLAEYIVKTVPAESASVVIAYDSRNYSDVFALEAALVLCTEGVKVYLFESLRPTPELSYALRELKAVSGIVVTASHNPPEYNGYKVYWDDGGQIVPPHDKGIIDQVREVSGKIPVITEKEARDKGLLVTIGKEIDDKFVEMIKGYSLNPELMMREGKNLKVVYTPLHGTGTMLVERILSEMGIQVTTVPEQREPDGNFPTVDFPNPEEASALKLGLDLAKKDRADLLMGTDPDSDRLGIAVPGPGGEFVLVNGNELGSLLADYVFSQHMEKGTMPDKPAMVKTIVTTELQARIATSYGAACYDVLTGFKYIADKIKKFEEETGESYVFGGEESYGYLIETEVRDKDAVSAAFMTAEMALYNRSRGWSVLDHLNDIHRRYGYFKEILISKYFKGQKGLEIMNGLMETLRTNPPNAFGSLSVLSLKDYKDGTTTSLSGGTKLKDIDLPSSNVLQFLLDDGSVVTARPSGTEPKIKFYASCCTDPGGELDRAKDEVGEKLEGIRVSLNSIIEKAESAG